MEHYSNQPLSRYDDRVRLYGGIGAHYGLTERAVSA
jgi:hypothetical protein